MNEYLNWAISIMFGTMFSSGLTLVVISGIYYFVCYKWLVNYEHRSKPYVDKLCILGTWLMFLDVLCKII